MAHACIPSTSEDETEELRFKTNRAFLCMLGIPVVRKLRQEDHHKFKPGLHSEFKTSLDYLEITKAGHSGACL